MQSNSGDSPLESISFNDNLPIAWEVLATMPSDGQQHRANRSNEELLQTMLLRDDQTQDSEEEIVSGQEHFRRLETRLDLLLSLVTEMMSVNADLPEAIAVTLSAHGFCAQLEDAGDHLQKNTLLKVLLYLDPGFPRPLTVYAQVVDVQPHSFTASFCPLEERPQDLLDKYIFRQHRRAIALARRS